MAGRPGNYSNVIIYDEKRRYYYLAPQKNRPLTDDELRNFNISTLDQLRRSIEGTYGDVAVPLIEHSESYKTTDAFSVHTTATSNDFTVKGGNSIEHPAILFVKGFYIFLSGDIRYSDQMYSSDLIDLNRTLVDGTTTDKTKTLTAIPDLNTPTSDRTDIVYVDLHFEEVTSDTGTDADVYVDSGLRDPRIGTASANRLRAVFDIRVYEGWTAVIDKNIFFHTFFLGGINSDLPPINQNFKVPIAAIFRGTLDDVIDQTSIVDLLSLYDKRIMTLEEITYRSRHGGYGYTAVFDRHASAIGFSGIYPQFPQAVIDEGAFATGLNRGFDTESFNTSSVTPRVLDNDGKFLMGALEVGTATGIISYPIDTVTGPVGLNTGEIVANQESVKHLYAGYALGVTGVREYADLVNINAHGLTGTSVHFRARNVTGIAAFSIHNDKGVTGVYSAFVESLTPAGIPSNFFVVDYKGRMGYNTFYPGWSPLPTEWNTGRYVTPPNVVIDVNDSVLVRNNEFIGEDLYVYGDTYSRTWSLPGVLSQDRKGFFGYTGIPQVDLTALGFTGSQAIVFFRPGIATQGRENLTDYRGFTGQAGFYESYTSDGRNLFTIGDLGEEYDRTVMTLYGTGTVPLYVSDLSFKYLSSLDDIVAGDEISYTIDFEEAPNLSDTITISGASFTTAIESLRAQLESQIQAHLASLDVTVFTLIADGTDDPYGHATNDEESIASIPDELRNHGKIIIRDKLFQIHSVVSFQISRDPGPVVENMTWTHSHFYGSGNYGGQETDVTFAKLDLGEAADAWLFNGDVFFNGNGKLNRVTFSPNVIFRNDIFVYGSLLATNLKFNRAEVTDMNVSNRLNVYKEAHVQEGLTVGYDILGASLALANEQEIDQDLKALVNGNVKGSNFITNGTDLSVVVGNTFPGTVNSEEKVFVTIGGSMTDESYPAGIHIIDRRTTISVVDDTGFRDLVLDFSDGNGNYGQLNVTVRGNLAATVSVASTNITAGQTEPNTDYDFFCKTDARIEGTLEVNQLKFIGEGTPGALSEITQPQNVIYFQDSNKVDYSKPYGIVRDKDFSIDVTLRYYNQTYDSILPNLASTMDQALYDEICGVTTPTPSSRVWNKDSMTYPEMAFADKGLTTLYSETYSGPEFELESSLREYNRYSFGRVTIATLGTAKLKWVGRLNADTSRSGISDIVQDYRFDSPYFRDKQSASVINWMPSVNRTIDNNFVVYVQASVIDNSMNNTPLIYNINRPVWVYLPLESWVPLWIYDISTTPADSYKTIVIFSAFNRASVSANQRQLAEYNTIPMTKYPTTPTTSKDPWSVSIYPRFKKITKSLQSGDINEYVYDAEWDVDLVIHSTYNTAASMVGKIYITKIS
jgi:hypothetical protein